MAAKPAMPAMPAMAKPAPKTFVVHFGFNGKTLASMDGTNPGDLCKRPIKLFDGMDFFHIYPKSGDILAVLLVLYPEKKENQLFTGMYPEG